MNYFSGEDFCTSADPSFKQPEPLTFEKLMALMDKIPKIEPPQKDHCQNCKVKFGGLIKPLPIYLGQGMFAPIGAYVCGHCWYKLKIYYCPKTSRAG